MDVNLRVPIGRWCLEEDSAVGGSGTADGLLASSGFLGLVLEGLGVHVRWVCRARVVEVGCCSKPRWMVIVYKVVEQEEAAGGLLLRLAGGWRDSDTNMRSYIGMEKESYSGYE